MTPVGSAVRGARQPGLPCDLPDPYLPEPAVVRAVKPEIPGVATFGLELQDPVRQVAYRYEPGQFNMLYVPGLGEVAISIAGGPATGRPHPAVCPPPGRGRGEGGAGGLDGPGVLHTIRFVGMVTRVIERLRPGDILGLRGPYGRGWPLEEARGQDVLIVAGGLGLAPLRPVLQALLGRRADYGRITLLYGARQPAELLYNDEFPGWEKDGLEVLVTVDRADRPTPLVPKLELGNEGDVPKLELGNEGDVPKLELGNERDVPKLEFGNEGAAWERGGWRGRVGVVPALVRLVAIDPARTIAFTCGPEIMMRFTVRELLARGLPRSRVFLSIERNMQCGVGLCGRCQLGPYFVCKDGPVFAYDRIGRFINQEHF